MKIINRISTPSNFNNALSDTKRAVQAFSRLLYALFSPLSLCVLTLLIHTSFSTQSFASFLFISLCDLLFIVTVTHTHLCFHLFLQMFRWLVYGLVVQRTAVSF